MMDRAALKAEIVRNNLTQKQLAIEIGMSPATFVRRMKRGVFGTDEVERMIKRLHITNPAEIFLRPESNS